MSKMGLLGAISFSLALVSLTQIPYSEAGCKILSAYATGPSSIMVKWEEYPGATNYFIDARVKHNRQIAPVVVSLTSTQTEKRVQGLQPGTNYTVTLKVFQYYNVMCNTTVHASTVPDVSHIIDGVSRTSTSIMVTWTDVPSAERYHLVVVSEATGQILNMTYTNHSAEVTNLLPSTNYHCYVYTANYVGLGNSSKVRTITTLVPPPRVVTAEQTGRDSARVSWTEVDSVVMYKVSIQEVDEPNGLSATYNVTDLHLDVDGVLPCSVYQISVCSYNTFLVPSEPTDHVYTTNKLTPVTSIVTDYSCATHSVLVRWSPVFGADSYRAVAIGENDTELSCNSESIDCEIYGLGCGQHYEVHVIPMSENCRNMVNTTSVSFDTVPCPPENLHLLRSCENEVIVFSWDPTSSAELYKATATDHKGVVQECLTEDHSCYFTHTVCGRHYHFSVYSISGGCKSDSSSTVDISTAPCIPSNILTSADCNSDVLISKWDHADGAVNYTVEAFGNKGNHSYYSCNTQTNSCAMEGLHCGEHLTVFIQSHDEYCSSPKILAPVAETVPCVPHNVAASTDCTANSVTVTWQITGSALFFIAMATDEQGVIHSCNSMALTCTIEGMRCGTNYTVNVLSSNFLCNSSLSDSVTIETVSCPPDNIAASLDCANNEALVSWRGLPKIPSFTAAMEDDEGNLLSCSTTEYSCVVTDLKCGKRYAVTVGNHDGVCSWIPSEPVYMDSVPCGPEVNVGVDCDTQLATISWNETINADSYLAVISGEDTELRFNITEHTISIDTLECGKTYTLTLTSCTDGCTSHPSITHFSESPCLPTNVMAERVCGQSFVDVTWEASRGAEYYKAAAVDRDGHDLHCMSNGTSCSLDGLMCGQIYTIGVSAMDSSCTSAPTLAEPILTAPCPPSHVEATLNCADNSASLSWSTSPNAVSYTGKAVSADGHTVTCEAGGDLSCQLTDLHCGTVYDFTVSASDGVCETPDSEPVSYTTGPCVVEDVENTLDCSTSTLTTSWTPADMPLNYTVTAIDENGGSLVSVTEESSSAFAGLPCGQQYTVTVTAVSSTCEGQSSEPQVVNSVPCVPDNIRGAVECSSNTLSTSWEAAAGASSYVTTLTGAENFSATCPTSDLTCSFPDLECAQTYSVEVEAVNDRCQSSASISIETAPCDPTELSAVLDCESGVATVSWTASSGAEYYTAVAHTEGYTDSCRSTGTSCELHQLMCGETYTVTVLAGDGTCNSTLLATTTVTTAPCAPVIDDHSLDCASNHATVSWIQDDDAVVVTVSATCTEGHQTSCSATADSSCVLIDLHCGSTYTVQAVAEGEQCSSDPSSTFEIITAPCTPANVDYTYTCNNGIAFVNWDETLGRDTFYISAESGDHMQGLSTSQTDSSLSSLLCGRLYDVKVTAVAAHCNSSQPGFVQIQTAPCSPHNISTSLICEDNTGAMSWDPSPGAVSYSVKATARDGDVKECQTNTTDCYIPHMHCAQTYVVVVTPYSESCQGFDSYPVNYVAGPCPPTDVAFSLQCIGNIGHVTWTNAPQGDLYLATAVHPHDSHNHTCESAEDGCSFTDLHCDEVASVSVVTRDRGCWSEPSESVAFETVVCPPSTVAGEATCSNNDITVSWDASTKSGVTYSIHCEEAGGATLSFTTTETSHVITGLQCGELYTHQVSVEYNGCTSVLSNATTTTTAPCPPTGLNAEADCGTNLGRLTWAASTYADSYTATVTGNHGHVVSCSSDTTNCSVKLECGHEYSAVVVASSATCTSSQSETLVFNSAACLPEGVEATVDCQANTFSVQWTGSPDIADTYTAIAIGSDNTRASCDSPDTECTITDLHCGMSYSIAVTAASIDCGSIDGSDYQILSAPCRPETVVVALECSIHTATVTWQNSGPDQMDMVSAVDSRGETQVCSSKTSNCTFEELVCGESYSISVVGETDVCSSDQASADVLLTAPCVPTHVNARVDCDTSITSVTWDGARGATSYTVFAYGNLGHYADCNSTDTNCNFLNLECGQDYNISVMARHSTCNSLISETVTATTGPCPHTNLQAVLHCDTNMAVASWTAGSGILYYNATASGFDVEHQQSCSTNGTSCNMTSLLCGESYRVTVSGQGRFCPSPAEEFQRIQTAPCPPTLVDVASSCSSNDITVTWETSQGSVSYMAVAENEEGQRWLCNDTSTSCLITGLPCGQHFEVYVAGFDETCIGTKSNTNTIYTAPCVPQNIQTSLDCPGGVLNITWESTGHAPNFRASVVSSSGDTTVCPTSDHYCVVPDMQCGLTYDVSVVAQDERCDSSQSLVHQVTTAPCPLTDFQTSIDCNTGVVSVTWTSGSTAIVYDVLAVDADGYGCSCNSTDGGCDLTMLKCGTEYSVTITPSRDGCVGTDSQTKQIQTVPCVPSLHEVEIDCLTNAAWVLGNTSAGAEDYIVTATDSNGLVQEFPCNSTEDDMCSLPPLTCSMNFTFTLKARNQECSSAASNVVKAETGPCSPQNITNSVDCDENIISIAWSPVPGAVSYTSTLEHLSGYTTCCSTPDNGCQIDELPCGEMYILLVTAEGRTCNSSESRGIARTVPCIPQNLQASLSCSNNVASMTWNYSRGGQFFKVKAVSTDGDEDECSNFENHCDLTELQCGKVYTATVVAEDSDCKSKPSDSVTIKTVPCTPAEISPVVNCDDNYLTVSWSESSGADSYIATILDSNGQTTTCQGTTEGSCEVRGLSCGLIYHTSVVASDGFCDSPPTPVEDTHPIPCEPRNIKAVIDCYTRVTIISWYPSDGAVSYNVTATAVSGHEATCETSMTFCEMDTLECGQTYHITVKAVGEECCRSVDMDGSLVTGPCIPEHITTQYSLSIGQVLWDIADGADSYSVEVVTDQGLSASCATNDTYCPIYGMQCGQTYSVTVTAHNDVCEDGFTSTEDVSLQTEPCPPNNVNAVVNCNEDTGVVTWEASVGALAYFVSLAGRDGHSLTCYSTETYCNIEGLHCSTVYYTNVIAMGETLNSTRSATVQLVAAPCAEADVMVNVDCTNNTAEVSWTLSTAVSSYRVDVVGSNGHRDYCESEEDRCDLTALQCGQTYAVTLYGISEQCQTEMNNSVSFNTRPCKPQNLDVDLECGTATATLVWEEQEGVELYMASATCSSGMNLYCKSTNNTCVFHDLKCGETYEFVVMAHNSPCCSENSSIVEIQTEPCQPTALTVSGSCKNDSVTLDWLEARGATIYTVEITGDLGYVTAFQTEQTSLEAELPCGQEYNFTVQTLGGRCSSSVSEPATFKLGPCVPIHVESFSHCEDNIGSVSWGPSDGADYYVAIAVGLDGHTHMCTSETTTCTWDDLHCGEIYTVSVIASDDTCDSMQSNTTTITMAPCIPDNLQVSLNCSLKVGSMSWSAVETAHFYIVTAESEGGHKVQLTTNDTHTYISEFMCGEKYYLSVQSADFTCTSTSSERSMLVTEPCPPTSVSSVMNCFSNIAVVSWNSSAGANFYTATVTPKDGQSQTCWSDSEQCGLPNLQCGQDYIVTVVASNDECNSDPSEENELQTVPCVPTDVEVSLDCQANEAVVSWSASQGALNYKVVAESSQGPISTCDTMGLSCNLTDLVCGQSYTIQVVAQDDICSSLPSQITILNSVPCTPDIGSVILDCYSKSVIVDWSFAEGAVNYIATARASGGHVSTCNSNITHCELLDLQCGQMYNVLVVATNENCDSPPSGTLQIESAPCPPTDVVTELDCSTNSAVVQWQTSVGADSYIVQAIGVEEDETSCESETGSCVLTDLLCSFTYNISVIAVNDVCNVSRSVMTQLHTVPCMPQYVQSSVDCESGNVVVSWEPSRGASAYYAVAQGSGGYESKCNGSGTTCELKDLVCGLNYSITVSASDNMCSSPESNVVELTTVPCIPQKVTAEMECSTNTGVVSWEEGDAVSSYSVLIYGPDGHLDTRNSEGTSVQFADMHCGQLYNVTVTANDGRCDNSHAYLNLQSVPCKPTNVKASLLCDSNSAAITWERASGAQSYRAVGIASDGSHRAECNNTLTHCDLTDLQCGTTYNVTVCAEDDTCSSDHTASVYVHTAPCPPQSVVVDAQCAEGAMTVSWSPNPDAQHFHASVVSDTGARLHCNSTGTSCTIHNLPCGQTYSVTVLSVRDECESVHSAAVETCSAPCVPTNIRGGLDCVSNAAWVTWDASEGASSYVVHAEGAGGFNSNCTSTSSPCSVPDLKCATLYTFHVIAVNKHCPSQASTSLELETGPCALTSINAVTQCNSNKILVEWELSENSPIYVVTAEGHDQTYITCNSTTNSCELEDIQCGTQYSIIVATSSDKCSSLRSPPQRIKTAPCIPENVTVIPTCEENGVVVSYVASYVATQYSMEVTGRDGYTATCRSTNTNCTLPGLPCGQPYELTIQASGENCTGPSKTMTFQSVPCAPNSVAVDVDCDTQSAYLTWDASEGAVEYFACAQSMDSALYCDTTDTSCTIEGLECGGVYNFSVEAANDYCNSSFTAPVEEGVAPCPPASLQAWMQKSGKGHWAMMSWEQVDCPDVLYLVTLIGNINNNEETQMEITSYWIARPYFEYPMPCSTSYSVSVQAKNSGGVSEPSHTYDSMTVPCAPQNFRYDAQTSMFSWDASVLASSYAVSAAEIDGSLIQLCSTADLSCVVSSLDSLSNIQVTASNSQGESLPTVLGGNRKRRDLRGMKAQGLRREAESVRK